MINRPDTRSQRIKRHKRVRAKISGTPERPRLNVFRSETNIYAQIIDDVKGTTLVSAISYDAGVVVTNVGDSRAYHITEDGITRVTKDHSLVESMVDRGDITAEEARRHPSRNLITRALGPDISADCDGYICPMNAGEYLLLCSDGLVNTVTDQEMLFEVIHGDGPDTCLDRLLAIARSQGAPDNVTAVLMQKQ